MKKITTLMLAALLALTPAYTAQTVLAEEPETISPEAEMGPIFTDMVKNGKLKVGIIGNDPTFCYHTVEDNKDVLEGFEVAAMYEMANRLSTYLGQEITVDFYESDFTGCMAGLLRDTSEPY